MSVVLSLRREAAFRPEPVTTPRLAPGAFVPGQCTCRDHRVGHGRGPRRLELRQRSRVGNRVEGLRFPLVCVLAGFAAEGDLASRRQPNDGWHLGALERQRRGHRAVRCLSRGRSTRPAHPQFVIRTCDNAAGRTDANLSEQ